MSGYPAENHWARRRALDLDAARPQFYTPSIELLQEISSASDGRAEARSSRMIQEVLEPARRPATYAEARAAILQITATHPDKPPEENDAAREMNLEALIFFSHLENFRANLALTRRAALEKRHSEVYQRCRELTDRVGALKQARGHGQTILAGLDDKRFRLQSERDAVQSQRPSKYPSRQELDAWKAERDVAQAPLEKALADCEHQQAAIDQTEWELTHAERALLAAQEEEQNLREQLNKE